MEAPQPFKSMAEVVRERYSGIGDGYDGMLLLAIYSLGLGAPFVFAALFLGSFASRMGHFRRAGRGLRYLAGGTMIAMGIA